MEVLERQLLENHSLREAREAIEQHTRTFAANGGATDRTVVTIPVVVHVVWRTTVQNISDAQIQSQLTVLNDDFRKLNADASLVPAAFQSLAADCEVNFCLAQQDPSGAATTGIERRQTTVTSFGTNDNMKFYSSGGLDAWDASKYLNLWVCNLSGGVLGYAQFPGGPANTDGVVCTYTAFGTTGTATAPFNKGRTATHEVGHWLNLYHIWGDDGTACTGSDNCADTPNQADENYGCPTFPQVSCSNGPNGDMFMNYMDYTDDACMYMFTTGQKNRAQAVLATGGSRASLASSPGCQAPGGGSCATPGSLTATSITSTSATLGWGAVAGAASYNLQWKTSAASTWTTVSSLTATSYSLSGLAASTTYNYRVQAVCATTGSYSAASSFTTTAASSCGTPSGLTATGITTSSATLNWAAVSGATSYSVQRKLASSSTWTTTNSITATSFSLTGLSPNTTYDYRVRATCGTVNSSYSATASFTTTTASCADQFEPNNSRNGAYTGTPVGTAFTAQIASASDVDWYRFANTTAQRNIKIELTTLPADYDVRLYRSNSLLATSQNAGTTDETIIYNNGSVSTSYYANVYGYNGANSNASCYTLKVSLSATAWRTDGTTDGLVDEIEITVQPDGIADFAMFPNPAANAVTLEIPMSEDADVQVAVLDPAGRAAVRTTESLGKANNRVNLDLSSLPSGIYFVQVRNGAELATRKLVVQQ